MFIESTPYHTIEPDNEQPGLLPSSDPICYESTIVAHQSDAPTVSDEAFTDTYSSQESPSDSDRCDFSITSIEVGMDEADVRRTNVRLVSRRHKRRRKDRLVKEGSISSCSSVEAEVNRSVSVDRNQITLRAATATTTTTTSATTIVDSEVVDTTIDASSVPTLGGLFPIMHIEYGLNEFNDIQLRAASEPPSQSININDVHTMTPPECEPYHNNNQKESDLLLNVFLGRTEHSVGFLKPGFF